MDPAEQLLPRSFSRYNPFFLPSCCRRLQSYRHFVGWADDNAVNHKRWPTSSAIPYMQGISPRGGYVGGTPLDRSVLGGLLQFADLHPIQIDFNSFHSLPCFENKFTLSLFNCQLKLCKCSFCASIVFQIVSLSFVLSRLSIYFADCSIDSIKLSFSSFNCHSLPHSVTFLWRLFILK